MRLVIKITGDYVQWNQYGQEGLRELSTADLEDMTARFAVNYKIKHGLGDCDLIGEVDESDPHTITIQPA